MLLMMPIFRRRRRRRRVMRARRRRRQRRWIVLIVRATDRASTARAHAPRVHVHGSVTSAERRARHFDVTFRHAVRHVRARDDRREWYSTQKWKSATLPRRGARAARGGDGSARRTAHARRCVDKLRAVGEHLRDVRDALHAHRRAVDRRVAIHIRPVVSRGKKGARAREEDIFSRGGAPRGARRHKYKILRRTRTVRVSNTSSIAI